MAFMGFCPLSNIHPTIAGFQDSNSGPFRLRDRSPIDGANAELTGPKAGVKQEGRPFRAFPPQRSSAPFGALDLHAVSDIASFCSEDQRVTMPRGFKAVLSARIRSLHSTEAECGSMLSWASSSLQSLCHVAVSRLPGSTPLAIAFAFARKLRLLHSLWGTPPSGW
jgi:hypothetical protein